MSAAVHFSLARMSLSLRLVSVGLFIIPASHLWIATIVPEPLSSVFLGVAGLVLVAFLAVPVFFRPIGFEVHGHTLTIRWLLRSRSIDLTGASVTTISRDELNRQYGLGIRIGAGGLGGAFGLYRTAKETFGLFVSTLDDWVLLRPVVGRALLITPEQPLRFIGIIERAGER